MFVAGGLPDGSLPAYLYTDTQDGQLRYAADIGPIPLSSKGEGRVPLTPQPGDPPGTYVVVVDPPPAGTHTLDPGLFVLPSGTVGDVIELAESVGLTCSELVGIDCVGTIDGAGFTVTIFDEGNGALSSVWVSADGASDRALALYGGMARIGTGMGAAEDWVRTATRSDERRFGDAMVILDQHPNGSWHVKIDPFVGSSSREVSSILVVEP